MKKIFFAALIAVNGITFAASSQWPNAITAYNRGNTTALADMSKIDSADPLLSYLYASASLNSNNPDPAIKVINNNSNNYFDIELMHQLLNYFFTNQAWKNYTTVYEQMPEKQITVNETCGYDVANFALDANVNSRSDFKWLIANKMPLWCISLIASQINGGSLDKSYLQPFLYNLINNDQTVQFNQLATTFKFNRVTFNPSTPSYQSGNKYQIVYRITNLSNKSPDLAFTELNNTTLDNLTKKYLYNQVAADLAAKQFFNQAQQAIEKGNDVYLSDDEYEWRVRISLAKNNWQQALTIINSMPLKLRNKNTWLYWKAYSYSKLGQQTSARKALEQIPMDYSYYALLAQAELRQDIDIVKVPASIAASDLKLAEEVKLSFELYRLGKQTNSALFVRLATQNLYYVIGQSSDIDIATISKMALKNGWNEMSIYAGNKLTIKSAVLSFPLLFTNEYKKYSQANNIDASYAMAVTRQESRFNPNALAIDGGVGLMQIMPATALYIAKKSGSKNCYKNYECNIKFGSWYLSHLYNKFDGNIIYSTAGYNAGPNRAHRWQQAFSELDNKIQIELIPFKITRDYVQKVLTNKAVYDKRLGGSSSLNMLNYLNSINQQAQNFIIDDDNIHGDGSY